MTELQQVEMNVVELCSEVGDFILAESLSFDKSRIEQKTGFNNLVSYVDKESERRIINALEKLIPGAGFLGEEGTDRKGTNDYRWIIDPLDGTTNFMHGLAPFAISIALSKKEKVVLGVVHEVTRKECFHSSENNPAFCNDRQIQVSPAAVLKDSLLATGFPYFMFEKMDAYLNIIREFLDKSHGIRRLGSAATDLAYVACGRMEGFFEYNLNSWDVAAGAFIVQQAGGTVTDFKGGNDFVFGGELCAGTKGIHPEMLAIIRKEWNR
jgi:myo-inositol-1(or 4)-monophosphatase